MDRRMKLHDGFRCRLPAFLLGGYAGESRAWRSRPELPFKTVKTVALRPAHRRCERAEGAVQAVAVDADAFHDALDVVARLADRDHLDPVDHVDLAAARIADRVEPARHAAGAGIVGGEGQFIGAAEA